MIGKNPISVVLDSKRSTVEEWSVKLDREIVAPPSVGEDGTLYVPTDRALIAMNPDKAEVQWQKELKGLAMAASPLVTQDTVIVSTQEAPLVALSRQDGEQRWSISKEDLPAPPTGRIGALSKDGIVYSDGWPGNVHLIGFDGQQRWTHYTRQNTGHHGGLSVGPDDTVYQADGTVTAIKDGDFVWSRGFRSYDGLHAGTRVTATDDGILFTTGNGKIRKMDHQGNTLWEFSGESHKRLDKMSSDERQALSGGDSFALSSTPVLSKDGSRIYAGSWDRTLFCLDADGNELWSKKMQFPVAHSGVQIGPDDTVYAVGDQEGQVYAMRPEDGSVLWTYTSDEKQTPSSLTLQGDRVILATRKGGLHALSSMGLLKALERDPGQPDAPPPTIDLGDGVITVGDIELDIRD